MNLLIKGAGFTEGYVMIAGPGDGILKMLEFGRVGVVRGRPYTGHTGTRARRFSISSPVFAALNWPAVKCSIRWAGGPIRSLLARP